MAEHATVIRIARYQPAAGKRDELVQRLQTGAAQIREMEGCFGAQICAPREAPEAIVAVSRWSSQAALDKFIETTASQRASLGDVIAGTPSAEHLVAL
jgi:quinol monooxygenase YgiN